MAAISNLMLFIFLHITSVIAGDETFSEISIPDEAHSAHLLVNPQIAPNYSDDFPNNDLGIDYQSKRNSPQASEFSNSVHFGDLENNMNLGPDSYSSKASKTVEDLQFNHRQSSGNDHIASETESRSPETSQFDPNRPIDSLKLDPGSSTTQPTNPNLDLSSSLRRSRRSGDRWATSVSDTDDRFERAAISSHPSDNQLHRQRTKNRDARRRKVRVTEVEDLVKEAIAATVSSALRQELEPLHTALRIVKLDTFTEGIVRQLSTLEHIQSKLLTEYGEMREAVSQASRNAQELAVQIIGLEAKIASLAADAANSKKDEPPSSTRSSSSSAESGGGPAKTEELKAVLMQASAAFSARLTATERRFKDDLGTLESRLSETVKRSQLALDSRLLSISSDTSRLVNKTSRDVVDAASDNKHGLFSVDDTSGQSTKFPFGPGRPFGPSFSLPRAFPSPSVSPLQESKATRDDFLLDQAGSQSESTARTDHLTDSLTLQPFPSWGRAEMVNLAVVTRLAAEIATRISKDALKPPKDCSDIAAGGEAKSGVYVIQPAVCSFRVAVKVWCDMDTEGGGWTVVQRRGSQSSGRDDFFRDWADYKWGFGQLEADHWIGNEHIHQLTSSGDYILRIELEDWAEERRWATYEHFYLTGETTNYTLHIGDYHGTAGNSLKYHAGAPFSSRDRDNDNNPMSHCARTFHGAWWFTACHESHLNGRYHRSPHRTYGDGINWMTFKGLNYSHKSSLMMVRPAAYSVGRGAPDGRVAGDARSTLNAPPTT